MVRLASLLLAFALSQTAAWAEPTKATRPVTAAMDCVPFTWAAVGEHERAAILVPISLDGQTYQFQLDTGADASFISESVAVEAGLMQPGDGGARVDKVELGGASIGPRWLLSRGSSGTIGLDMLVGYTTVIDYPAQRFCMTPTADLPYDIYKQTSWADAVLRHGKLFVPVELDGERRDDFFFDTGASLFALSTDLPVWKLITGRHGDEAENRRISGQAWGADVSLIGAPSLGPIKIAALPPANLEVWHRSGDAERFAKYPFPASGLIGNAGVWDRTVVLTLGARPRFGVVEAPEQ